MLSKQNIIFHNTHLWVWATISPFLFPENPYSLCQSQLKHFLSHEAFSKPESFSHFPLGPIILFFKIDLDPI